jgi:hypothetical protein
MDGEDRCLRFWLSDQKTPDGLAWLIVTSGQVPWNAGPGTVWLRGRLQGTWRLGARFKVLEACACGVSWTGMMGGSTGGKAGTKIP